MGEVNKENLDEAALSEKRESDLESEADDVGGSRKKHKTETENPDSVPEEKGEAEGNDEEEKEEEEYSDEEDEGCEEEGASDISEEEGEEDVDDDRKGKGIMKGDKGKGKLEVEEENDSDDSDDGGNSSDGDSDFSDDPLLEVDLNNILPSRTTRRVKLHPASFLAADLDDDSDA